MRQLSLSALLLLCSGLRSAAGCTMIAAGRNATTDGSTLIAHTDDAGFGAADIRLVRVPAQNHSEGSERAVYNPNSGYPRLLTTERGSHYAPNGDDQQPMQPLGLIPQARHTYAYFDLDYGMMNEVQLSIGESTCGAKTVGWPLDQPNGYNMFGIAELSKVALERCDSARCAVQTMGDLAVQFGFYSEDSGDPNAPDYTNSAEALGIGDKYGEAWVFHVLTGKNNASAVWAAQRVADDHVTVVANGFIIRELDLNDTDNYMASHNVLEFAEEMGWWSPEDGPLDFSAAYGFDNPDPRRALYEGRRMWRVYDIVAPSLKLDARHGYYSAFATYPFSVKPDAKLSVSLVLGILRDYYQGTEFDMTKGLAAGPFGNPMRWDGDNKGVLGGWERPISMYRTVYSFVLKSRSFLSDSVGGVAWYGLSTPHSSVYVPFSCAQSDVPASYLAGKESEFSQDSAWWAFNFVNNWSLLRFDAISRDIRAKRDELQILAFERREAMEAHVSDWKDDDEALQYIQEHSNALAADVVKQWWAFAWHLVGKFTDGYITKGEKPGDMLIPGYPALWLAATEFASFPGDSLAPPRGAPQKALDEFRNDQDARRIATAAQPRCYEHSRISALQIAAGALCGGLVGAAVTVLALQWSRRAGYSSIA